MSEGDAETEAPHHDHDEDGQIYSGTFVTKINVWLNGGWNVVHENVEKCR